MTSQRQLAPDARAVSGLEQTLVQMWCDILEVSDVAVEDNFFDLGGTSRLAAELAAMIEQRFGVSLSMDTLVEDPTVSALATRIRSAAGDARSPGLGLVRFPGGDGRLNLFCIHGMGGHVLVYGPLARALAPHVTVYGIESSNRYADAAVTMSELVDHSEAEIRRVQPRGPYRLAGYSMGGLVALDLAARFEAAGDHVELVALIDTDLVEIRKPVDERAVEFVSRALGVEPPVTLSISAVVEAAESIRARLSEQSGRPCRLATETIAQFARAYVRNQAAASTWTIGPKLARADHVILLYSMHGPHAVASGREAILQHTGWSAADWSDRIEVVPIDSDHWSILGSAAAVTASVIARAVARAPGLPLDMEVSD